METTIETIRIECPDCYLTADVEAEIDGEVAWFVCGSTFCDRQFDDPTKCVDWFVESSECDADRQGDR